MVWACHAKCRLVSLAEVSRFAANLARGVMLRPERYAPGVPSALCPEASYRMLELPACPTLPPLVGLLLDAYNDSSPDQTTLS
eukprot:2474781-Lingulodinium_polyedra.AAC.1